MLYGVNGHYSPPMQYTMELEELLIVCNLMVHGGEIWKI